MTQTGSKSQIIEARARPELKAKNPTKLEAQNIQARSSSSGKQETGKQKGFGELV